MPTRRRPPLRRSQPFRAAGAGGHRSARRRKAATPRPRKPAIATETQLLEYGSFELPRVKERTPRRQGGDFLKFALGEWVRFEDKPDDDGGKLVAGVTNEVARTGRQSLFIEFTKLTKPQMFAEISSQPIPVKPSAPYRVSIWGRMDKKQPLTIEQRIPNLYLQVDFFQADGETQTGDQVFRVQPMPGSRRVKPFFSTERWSEYYAEVETPEDAGYLKITWRWATNPPKIAAPGAPPDKSETNGVMYFDDATLIGERVDTDEPEPEETPEGTPGAESVQMKQLKPGDEAAEPPESTEFDLDLPPEIANKPSPIVMGLVNPAATPPADCAPGAPTATPTSDRAWNSCCAPGAEAWGQRDSCGKGGRDSKAGEALIIPRQLSRVVSCRK